MIDKLNKVARLFAGIKADNEASDLSNGSKIMFSDSI
jgi:hypothetical protein